MGITISPVAGLARLQVTGDIDAVLAVPFDDDDRFLVGASDGTLLLGTYDECLRCTWTVAQNGAAITRIAGDRVDLEWTVEWLAVGLFSDCAIQSVAPEPLPLFPGLAA